MIGAMTQKSIARLLVALAGFAALVPVAVAEGHVLLLGLAIVPIATVETLLREL